MAEGTYEYECNRAELLGVDPPSRVLWEEAERVRKEQEQADEMTVSWHSKIKRICNFYHSSNRSIKFIYLFTFLEKSKQTNLLLDKMQWKRCLHKFIKNNIFLLILQEIDIQDEQINQTTGKVDELTNILSITQMRLNKFKVC